MDKDGKYFKKRPAMRYNYDNEDNDEEKKKIPS